MARSRNRYEQPTRPLKDLQPAPPALPPPLLLPPLRTNGPIRTPPPETLTSFLDLPAELRLEIYYLALKNVTVHIIPHSDLNREYPHENPHALLRTSRQIRLEVLPIMHNSCPIRATITDFDFSGLLAWLARIPPDAQAELRKNPSLSIRLCTTQKVPGDLPTLRRWLHHRADFCRPQPDWQYSGPTPSNKVANDLRRRVRRMNEAVGFEARKQAELKKMIKAIGVHLHDYWEDSPDTG